MRLTASAVSPAVRPAKSGFLWISVFLFMALLSFLFLVAGGEIFLLIVLTATDNAARICYNIITRAKKPD